MVYLSLIHIFTASLEIKLHSDYANSDSIAKIEKMIKKNSNIQDVLYRKELIDAVNENIRNISLVLLALAVVLTFISFALINNCLLYTSHLPGGTKGGAGNDFNLAKPQRKNAVYMKDNRVSTDKKGMIYEYIKNASRVNSIRVYDATDLLQYIKRK